LVFIGVDFVFVKFWIDFKMCFL